ncbi:S8 family serine peptidase [Kouleothrix sp.]|uniref:S8 family serine peptidase n=1 Tax=Kouleothrix sp. TaxID=2779161 RepID=UPI00391B2E79
MDTAPRPPEAPPPQGCLDFVLFAAAVAWVAGVTIVLQAAAWFYEQFQLASAGLSMALWYWPLVTLLHALLVGTPVLLLALFARAPRFRAIYRTWALAGGAAALFGLARALPLTWTQPAAVAQIALALAALALLPRLRFRDEPPAAAAPGSATPGAPAALGAALGLLALAPWLRAGALGSPTDTLLNAVAALLLGAVAGFLLARRLVEPLQSATLGVWQDVGLGGIAAGVALLLLGAGFGFGGSQLVLMLGLLPLGGAAYALGRWAWQAAPGRAWLAIVALIALAAAGPLLLFDPDEYMLVLGFTEIGLVLRTMLLMQALGALAGLVLLGLSAGLRAAPGRWASLGALAASLALALALYGLGGQPGFYGEKLFVILRDQADVSAAARIPNRVERLRSVYTTLTRHADTTQANLRATLDQFGVRYQPYYLVNAIEVDGGPLLRAYLAAQPEVDRVLDSPHLRPLPQPVVPEQGSAAPPGGPQWNVVAIGADRVWDELGVTGRGIVVGESDSGVQGDHPALREAYRGRGGQNDYNWLDPWFGSSAPTDVGGHGTHTTGTILGSGGIGVAPGAQWIGCVNLGRNLGNPAYYLNCMQFMLAPYPQHGDPLKDGDPARAAYVLNNSWGCPPVEGCDPASLAPAVRALRAAGIFVVASAGNEGPRCGSVSDPIAIYDAAFSVGAVDRAGDIASFSSRGPVNVDGSDRVKPDIMAPGVGVLSALPGGTYGENSGTSMAGPHVAGVVALMWSAQPKLIGNIDRTEQLLIETARPYEGARAGCFDAGTPNDAVGYGVVDAYAAVKAALAEP